MTDKIKLKVTVNTAHNGEDTYDFDVILFGRLHDIISDIIKEDNPTSLVVVITPLKEQGR